MGKRPREHKPIHPALVSVTGPSLIKHLASCNTTVRSQSLRLLQAWLASQSAELSNSDIRKLWKGLFYCLWHSDKMPNQVALINRLTSLFQSLQPSLSLEFFRVFLVTLRREWPGIDRLRLDKFYLLIRRFMTALFELMRLRNWNVGELGNYLGVLETDGFLADDKLQGNGVNYHLASVFLEELKAVGFPVRKEVVDLVLGPFLAVLTKGNDKILMGKVKSYVFDELVAMGKAILAKKKTGEDCDEKDGDFLLGVVALKMGLAGKCYEIGSSVDCIQANRKLIYGLHNEFLKLEKDLELSGFEIAIPEYSNVRVGGDNDEVPQLIPIDFDASKNGEETMAIEGIADDDERVFKKSKKVKKDKDKDDKKRKKKNKTKKKDENTLLEVTSAVLDNGDLVKTNEIDDMKIDETTTPALSETVILNLQRQFEKVAGEFDPEGCEDGPKRCKKKRKKGLKGQGAGEVEVVPNSVEKGVKKVRFAMKNNLVWKPQNPLPPESLRLPPSVTPRGSALKKGVPPGPVIEASSVAKRSKAKKKAQNRVKSATTLMKQRKKLQLRSA